MKIIIVEKKKNEVINKQTEIIWKIYSLPKEILIVW